MRVVRLPVKYRRPRVIGGREVWASPEPSDLMVWEVCPYIAGHNGLEEGCQGCPEWSEDPVFGTVKRGCRAMAEEACRVMLAVQRIGTNVKIAYDSKAGVWYVEDSDLPGVNAEAPTLQELRDKLPRVIADLLD